MKRDHSPALQLIINYPTETENVFINAQYKDINRKTKENQLRTFILLGITLLID